MAAAQATFEFPLMSLPAGYHLLVISPQSSKTNAEEIMLFILPPQKNNCITLPQKESIKPILSHTNALIRFHRAFDKETKNKYRTAPLRKKLLQSLLCFSDRYETPQEISWLISRLSRTSIIYLLNVRALEAQYIQIGINEKAIQCSIESLHHGAQLLHDQMLATNVTIYEFLDHVADNKTEKLHWSLNHLKMRHNMEQTTKMQFLHILQEAINMPNQLPLLKIVMKQLLKHLTENTESKRASLPNKDYHFIIRGFWPSFDPHQKMLRPELKDRIHGLAFSDLHIASLVNFCFKLKMHFKNQIYCSTSDEKE